MSGINANGGIGGVSLQNLQSMDVETALMAVQQERTRLLDTQLQSQIQEVQNRNDMIAKLNTVLSALNSAAAQFKSGASATDTIPDWNNDKVKAIEIPLNDAIKAAGLGDLGFTARQGRISNPSDSMGTVLPAATNIMQGGTTKGEIDGAINKVKGMIDSAGNSQQMDMLRLQSMTNKRNEAFDVMTNFVKKMQESRSSIIGNMR
ncbi:hypothetical protein [Achromobacter xylosoxidans]|uniref:hypothetical protein n=1 Tax=Alcaligenes xylosoxydans xylosoxydans TaxID=85698 RepID=UPI0006C356D9|nr:hypothetical protein [Achromobacter xylosoxidans]MCH4571383.1 hypothetical protein [Achromobacter xylosoxidans]MCV6903076.1 hypothetical protein [Achromobacter xylosoxidans]MDD7990676.1 hypothetical protein [Achromobacter xylosoxidans]OFO57136.1 hypothetical protein HMPREF3024_06380 [Achromobacter xylosoxidans]OMG85254.1 hypothetical protein BIZ53_23760 [Achromobacter xylosoxidans]